MQLKSISNFALVKEKKDDGTFTAVASSPRIDRDGEVILPSAFANHLDLYRANPVIMAAHMHWSFDGSPTIIGSASHVEVEKDALTFDATFASTPAADQWHKLFDEGHARAFSVGFIPIAGEYKKQGDQTVYVHTEVELLEISAVPVPSNPDARVRGVDPNELKKLVEDQVRKTLDEMYAQKMLKILERKG